MIHQRFLPARGIHNLRDYGGYRVAGGARLKTGLLYRSGQHFGASDADLAMVDALAIRTVIDLRGNGERERNPCRRVDGWEGEVVFFDGETTNSPPHMDVGARGVTAQLARERMIAIYTRMTHNPAMHAIFRDYFRALAAGDGASLVHCFAGKDRTGMAVALLQQALGVSRGDALADFLLTNEAPTQSVLRAQSLPNIEARFGPIDEAAVRVLMEVDAAYFETFHREIEREWGSLEAYLERVLAVDDTMRDALHARFVA